MSLAHSIHFNAFLHQVIVIVGSAHVITDSAELGPYETDALTAYRQRPNAVILPADTVQIAAVLKLCTACNIAVVPRGAGTSLSGGAVPVAGSVVLSLTRLNRILDIDYDARIVRVQPGVTNLDVSNAVHARGFFYAPDPSSQIACTIGGNVAENAGGVHCFKYGVTAHHVVALETVLMNGDIVQLGGTIGEAHGLNLMGLMLGSEGLLGIITAITLRIIPLPDETRTALLGFASVADAARCVAAIISCGIVPAAIEMMDRAAIHVTEAFVKAGYPLDAEALLIVELDGTGIECSFLLDRIRQLSVAQHATTFRVATDENERLKFWKGRKSAFPAVGRISPDYYCVDGTIPRRTLPNVLQRIAQLSVEHDLRVVNVFHAGDGNLHPMILYDASSPGQLERSEKFGAAILKLCVEVGGVLSGEHGIGIEKRALMGLMFNETDLQQQQQIKCALDPNSLLNPGKVYPTLHRCAELGHMHVHHGETAFPLLPRY